TSSSRGGSETSSPKNRQRAWFDIHSAAGVMLGLAMFVVSFSGVLSLFSAYYPAWERVDLRVPPGATFDPEAALEALKVADPDAWARLPVASMPEAAGEAFRPSPLFFFAPTSALPFTHIRWFDGEAQESYDYYVDVRSGRVVSQAELGLRQTLVHFHTDLLLPRPFGRYLVGVLGVGFLFVIVSGVFFHRKMLGQMFVFRRSKNLRQLMADSHKLFGAWGLLFHAMITFTGAFLGLIGVFLLVSALTVYRGDQDAAFAAVVAPTAEPAGEAAPMLPLGEILERSRAEWPELDPVRLTLHAYNDRMAEVVVSGPLEGRLAIGGATGSELVLSAVDGEVRRRNDWANGSIWQRLIAWVVPLHYATFGGLVLKLAYCLLGLGSALMSVTGLLVWLERRGGAGFRWLERLTIGVCAGQPAATAVLSAVTPWVETASESVMHGLFVCAWLLTIIFAFRAADRRRAAGWLLSAAGVLAALAVLSDAALGAVAGSAAWQTGSASAAGVSVFLLVFGALSFFAGGWLLTPAPDEPASRDKARRGRAARPASAAG
ncbi:MAG: PepSY-associated TM helix domain-containing protein, partial [Acidobacteriota bacterium]